MGFGFNKLHERNQEERGEMLEKGTLYSVCVNKIAEVNRLDENLNAMPWQNTIPQPGPLTSNSDDNLLKECL